MNDISVERTQIENFVGKMIGEWRMFIDTKNIWENVVRHCLLEAARASVFADMLRLDPELKKDLILASALHDGNKQQEVSVIKEELANGRSGFIATNVAGQQYLSNLRMKGVPDRTLLFLGIIGGRPEMLVRIKNILDKKILTDEDVAILIVHYIDDYTRNDDWVEPATQGVNDVDRRFGKNKQNPNYQKMNEESIRLLGDHPFFSGMDGFSASIALSHMIEERLADLVKSRSGTEIKPLEFPEVVDMEVRRRI